MTGRKARAVPLSADEHARLKAEKLQNDPQYRAEIEAVENERRIRAELLREAERPIVMDLHTAGLQVDSVWDLVNTSDPYPEALPILVAHLKRGGYPERVMESLGRALAVEPAVRWWEELKTLYLNSRDPGEEDGTAVALAACATKAQLSDLVSFLSAPERGESRIYFLRPIKKLGGSAGQKLIESLTNDPTFGPEARALLGTKGTSNKGGSHGMARTSADYAAE